MPMEGAGEGEDLGGPPFVAWLADLLLGELAELVGLGDESLAAIFEPPRPLGDG